MVAVGGPVLLDMTRPGLTVNFAVLVPVPPAVVTATGPVDAVAGTVAVILVSEFTVNMPAAPPNVTLLAPVNPDPVTVTLAPMVPEDGVNEETTGPAASAGGAVATSAPRVTARAASAVERRRARTRRPGHDVPPRADLPGMLMCAPSRRTLSVCRCSGDVAGDSGYRGLLLGGIAIGRGVGLHALLALAG